MRVCNELHTLPTTSYWVTPMKIKEAGVNRSALNPFDLLGTDEVGLSKAFAYVMGREPAALYSFLRYIGMKTQNTDRNFRATSIEVERVRDEGRTDIEIKQPGKFHVIIESKVKSNKVKQQRTQYLKSFDNERKKVLCFITGVNDFNKEIHDDIEIQNLGWLEIIDLFGKKRFTNNNLIRDFLVFMRKGFNMREQKEILVQDLGNNKEIRRFLEFQVYRRDVVFGSPLYFSPYFTRLANRQEGEGIFYLSKILGVLSLKPESIDNFKDDLYKFSNNCEKSTNKWIEGVKSIKRANDAERVFTYFFLDTPLKLRNPLKKDVARGKERGVGWIGSQIPKNRCVSFLEFARRMSAAEIDTPRNQ